jgi:hypothetical protein
MLLIVGVLACIAVIAAYAVTDPAEAPPIDRFLQPGECVRIESNGDAAETLCDGSHDGVVRTVVGFDQVCPADTDVHRDQLGRGWACIDRTG